LAALKEKTPGKCRAFLIVRLQTGDYIPSIPASTLVATTMAKPITPSDKLTREIVRIA
jgi:hypothetical protein